MHDSAMYYGRAFFETYCAKGFEKKTIVDVGAQDVNGSLRSFCPSGATYIGVDFVEGAGVDVVLSDPYELPFTDASIDVVVCSSVFEHSELFWLLFLECIRILKPDGLLYLNAPSNGPVHRWPGDFWRFYPDAGHALVNWSRRSEYRTLLLESFIAEKQGPITGGGRWNDFVAVVLKDDVYEALYPQRILEGRQGIFCGYSAGRENDFPIDIENPDYRLLLEQQRDIDSRDQALAVADADLGNIKKMLRDRDSEVTSLKRAVAECECRMVSVKQALVKRDARIVRLHQAVVWREARVVNFNQAVAERESQNANLKQAVADRDGQIVSLNLAVAEREDQNANLKQAVVDRDAEIRNLHQQWSDILRSRSWRVTAPLRKAVVTVRRGLQSPSMSLPGKFAEYLRIQRDVLLGSAVRQVRDSSFFDAEYYLSGNPDVRNAGVDPAKHYVLHGWRERRDPSAAFSTSQYLVDNPDVATARVNPLLHYLRCGRLEGRSLGPRTSAVEVDDLRAVVDQGNASNVTIDAEVDNLCVVDEQEKASDAAIDAEVEAIRKSGLFDVAFYHAMYSDLPPAGCDPIRHYCEVGWREGRNPSEDFDTNYYLANYSDIQSAGINPFWHYVVAGASEQRRAGPNLATVYERSVRFGVVDTDIKLLAFYASPDWATLRSGRPKFKGHPYQIFPHEELGPYDPSDWRVLKYQAELAKRHGLYGFCFDFAVGASRGGPAQPLDSLLGHEDIDFGFCVQADLPSNEVLAPFVASLVRAVSDRRYIRIRDRPLFLFTIPSERPRSASVLGQLRRLLADQGVGNPFVIGRRASSAGENKQGAFPADFCDAVLDLSNAPVPDETGGFLPLNKNGVDVVPYMVIASQGIARAQKAHGSSYPLYHLVTLGRDNTSQRPERPLVYTGFHLKYYRCWLDAAIASARVAQPQDRRFVFVNAWNDWNEGLFLEPDSEGGFGRLNETTRALLTITSSATMPKVSVIVPNYNHERFLRHRLDSIYGQTYRNIEVILLDDCSSDQSRSLMDQYAAAYPDITRTLYNVENSGSAFRQWAKGIKAATGDLVWIAESDDYCDENFLEVLVPCFEDEAVLLAYSKCVFVSSDEVPMRDQFQIYVSDLECARKWNGSYVETAHNEVRTALGIKNTIPNASGVLFKRSIDMPLLEHEPWLSMAVAGDWVFYLHLIRGGKIAYSTGTTNFFRRYEGSTAEVTYKKEVYYREVGMASRTVAKLYNVPLKILEQCREGYRIFYKKVVGHTDEEFALWYDYESILRARDNRSPNILVSTMAFFPGGAEILPIRLANEFKRKGLSVLLLNAGLMCHEDKIRRMLRNDVPLIETSDVEAVKAMIHDFGVEVLNTHQWHIQKYPLQLPDVFDGLRSHVASLHGMIEHEDAFGVTEEQLRKVDQKVTTWVYTAEKNLGPFANFGLYDKVSGRFVKVPNGLRRPSVKSIPRTDMGIPEDAFVLCCVSRAIPDKGWAEATLVVERARALSGRDIRLILVGNGPVYDEYCWAGTPDFVYLAGFSENAVGHYAAADMGIMLTKFKSESFPLTIVDCLFAGKPYIATDVGDIRNMLTTSKGVAGEVIELEDWNVPIERAAQVVAAFTTDQQKYANALALVQEVATRYDIDVVASQYVRLFEGGCEAHRLRSSS